MLKMPTKAIVHADENDGSIATNLGIGDGSVTKTIKGWMLGLDYPEAEELRELAVHLRKLGIPASRYAEGARIASILVSLGLGDEHVHDFLSGLYSRCQKTGFQPEQLGSILIQLSGLSDSVPLQQIAEYVDRLMDQKRRKELELHQVELEKQRAEERRDIALTEEKTTYENLNAFITFRAAMRKATLSMLDLPRFITTLTAIRQFGFDPEVIAGRLSNLEKAETDVEAYELKAEHLKEKCKILEAEKLAHIESISIYKDLEGMRMGIRELKLLWHTMREIAEANNIPQDEANQKFFGDIRTQYDYKLGFETTLQNLNADIQRNEQVKVYTSMMTAFLNSIILQQYDQIQRVSGLSVFGPLAQAAKGESVPINQLKSALINLIDMLIGRADPTDQSTKVLKNARVLIQQGDTGDIA